MHEFSRQDLSDPLPGSPLAIDHDRKDLNGKIRQCRIGHFGTDPLLFADDVFAATADDQLIARTDHCPGCHLIDDLPLLAEPFDENTLSVALHDGFEFVDGTPALEPFVIGAENPENDLPGRRVEAGFQADVFAHLLLQIARRLLHLRHAAQQPEEKNGRFYFVINLYDANGKRKIKWISTGLTVRGNKRKAESMLREVLLNYDETGELPTGRGGAYEKVDAKTAKPLPQHLQPVNKSEMLFLDYLNEWVQVHKASIQPATFISYNRMITGRITQYFEPLGLKLCEVTPQVLDEFQEKILLEGYTTNTVIHYHAIFGKAFKDAVRKDYLETNPMLKVDRPKKNSFRPNFYSKDEVQQLLEVSQDDPLHLCILITAYYGLRRSEVLGLKWSSIDFERKSITINHKVTEQLVNGKYVPVVSDVMKNKTSCRTLPLIPAVEEELLKQKEKQQLYRKLFKKSYSTEYLDFVCTDQEGKLIRPNFVTEHFDWLLTKYGLKHIRFHDLRHSCASLMVMNGVSMKQVQEWLGHSTFSTTADIYAHLDYKSKQGSAGVIANLLGESKFPK